MNSIVAYVLTLCAAVLALQSPSYQVSLESLEYLDKANSNNMAATVDGNDLVPDHSGAKYGPVPKEEQIFRIEFLEIAPTPIVTNRIFFAYLRGDIPESKKKELGLPDNGLVDATLKIGGSAIYEDDTREEPEFLTIPFKSFASNRDGHLVIRDPSGEAIDYLPSSGRGEVLLDFQIFSLFLRSGMWTFSVDARAGDKNNTCLFAMTVTQWLDGDMDDL